MEKSAAYMTILKASVLAFDATTGTSRFSWAYGRLSALGDRAKQVALLHTEVTIASICKAFLAFLHEEEATEAMLQGIAESSAPVSRSIHRGLAESVPRLGTEL